MTYTSILIVEDGSNVPNANAYDLLVNVDNYHALHGNASWPVTPINTDPTYPTIMAQKENALINATQSIELLYGQRYLSLPQYSTQSLLWPRFVMVINHIQVIQPKTIPTQLKQAMAEVALMVITGVNVFPLPNTDNYLKAKTAKVGDLEVSQTWGRNPLTERFTGFNKVELILTPILRDSLSPTMLSL